jgi:hypothetical protein
MIAQEILESESFDVNSEIWPRLAGISECQIKMLELEREINQLIDEHKRRLNEC